MKTGFASALVVAVGCCSPPEGCKMRPAPQDEGGSCERHIDCAGDLVCTDGRCAVGRYIHRKMSEQSGTRITSERPKSVSGPGSVRVRSATGSGIAFVTCADDERLLGGWCDPPGHTIPGNDRYATLTHQEAFGYSEHDTVSAGWRCRHQGIAVRAFAFCQRLGGEPPALDASSPPAPNR